MKSIKLILIISTLALLAFAFCFKPDPLSGQERVQKSDLLANWRPMQDVSGISYVGSDKCIQCHENAAQLSTSMAHALLTPTHNKVLNEQPLLTFRNGDYFYELKRQGEVDLYTVTDGKNTISEPVMFSFGEGRISQAYIFRHNGLLYESRISFYRGIKGLDFTVAQTHEIPTSLENALGREVSAKEQQNCFGCHATAAVSNGKLQLDRLTPGVNCEACHGPGEKHITAVKAKEFKNLQIFNPGNLSSFELTQEFCGSCHVSFDKVLSMPEGTDTLRFQPYRLFNSKGHSPNDSRLSCVACHDPHEKVEHEPAYFDSKCTACHLTSPKEAKTSLRMAPACPVSTQKCVTCHMPKTDVPDMHFKFTDHQIQIVKSTSSH
ncbi:MAG: multiheme c-type cytochrome [Pyrinomonadaceae bacterium]